MVDDQFKPLDTLKDQISSALNDKDPLKQRWAFYLFYWRFAPGLCKRFPIAICCEETRDESTQEGAKSHSSNEDSGDRIGCERGDWHPSVITVDKLTALVCCAARNAQTAKTDLQAKTDEVEKTRANLAIIKKRVETDEKALEDLIKTHLNKVVCQPAASSS